MLDRKPRPSFPVHGLKECEGGGGGGGGGATSGPTPITLLGWPSNGGEKTGRDGREFCCSLTDNVHKLKQLVCVWRLYGS